MNDLEILARILLAIGFGAILGLETETRTSQELGGDNQNVTDAMQHRLGGVRTYTVLALFGAIGGLMFSFGYEVFAYLVFTAVFFIVLAAYVLNIQYRKAFGMTTEIAILITVLIGFAATSGIAPLEVLIVIMIILTFILSQKQGIASLVSRIQHEELIDIIKFTILALVILPFLPNVDIYIRDLGGLVPILQGLGLSTQLINRVVIFNPFRLWQYVVLISGFNIAGYFANKLWGKRRGMILTGVFGGFISSTVTTISLALRSEKEHEQTVQRRLGAVTLLANSVSFIPMLALAASASLLFFQNIITVSLALSLGTLIIGLIYLLVNKDGNDDIKVEYEPFSLYPALKFALLLTTVKLILQIVDVSAGNGAFVILTALSGIVGIDVATISLGELVAAGSLSIPLAVFTFLISNIVNFAAKSTYSLKWGTYVYAKAVAVGMAIASLAAMGLLFLVR